MASLTWLDCQVLCAWGQRCPLPHQWEYSRLKKKRIEERKLQLKKEEEISEQHCCEEKLLSNREIYESCLTSLLSYPCELPGICTVCPFLLVFESLSCTNSLKVVDLDFATLVASIVFRAAPPLPCIEKISTASSSSFTVLCFSKFRKASVDKTC